MEREQTHAERSSANTREKGPVLKNLAGMPALPPTKRSVEEMRQKVRQGMSQIRENKYCTQDELDDFVFS